jgi:GntR family transcriptional regulator
MQVKMIIKIDFRSHIPINTQIIEQIKYLISTGELAPGERLPTLRELAAQLQVNFTTVARAYRTLDAEGLISTQHGRGTFVLGPATEAETDRLREQSLDSLTTEYLRETRHLGFEDQAILQAIQRYLGDAGSNTKI